MKITSKQLTAASKTTRALFLPQFASLCCKMKNWILYLMYVNMNKSTDPFPLKRQNASMRQSQRLFLYVHVNVSIWNSSANYTAGWLTFVWVSLLLRHSNSPVPFPSMWDILMVSLLFLWLESSRVWKPLAVLYDFLFIISRSDVTSTSCTKEEINTFW